MRLPFVQPLWKNISTSTFTSKTFTRSPSSFLITPSSSHLLRTLSTLQSSTKKNNNTANMVIANPVLLVCDIQEAFRTAIYEYPSVISTAKKVLRASQILNIPHFVTTQNAAKLKPTVRELDVPTYAGNFDKTRFSMAVPELLSALSTLAAQRNTTSLDIAIVGIEAHVCVLQSVLDLRRQGHNVWVLADGVSSSSLAEVGVAFERMRGVGAVISTSESWMFEVMGDSEVEGFREIQKLIKEEGVKWASKHALEKLVAKI